MNEYPTNEYLTSKNELIRDVFQHSFIHDYYIRDGFDYFCGTRTGPLYSRGEIPCCHAWASATQLCAKAVTTLT